MNAYSKMEEKQHNEFNAAPKGDAFSSKQFKAMIEQWDLSENDTDKGSFLK